MNMILFRNYLKVAIRSLTQNKFYSTINILGLSVGITVSLLISFYVLDELSYDKFHKDVDRMYQVFRTITLGDIQDVVGTSTGSQVAATFKEEVTGVEDAIRLYLRHDIVVGNDDKVLAGNKVLYADANFFNFFSFRLIEGDKDHILNEPNQLVLSEKSARNYLGYDESSGESPVGKTMYLGNDKILCTVVGIAKDAPSNSQFGFDIIVSLKSHHSHDQQHWGKFTYETYLKLENGADPMVVQERIEAVSDKYAEPVIQDLSGMTFSEWREKGNEFKLFIQPFGETYLHSRLLPGNSNIDKKGNALYIYLLSMIGVLIIIIACVNFMNLSTARSATRAKEVGIRKTVGAARRPLIGQFLLESLITSTISTIVAITNISLVLPYFNQISEKNITEQSLYSFGAIGTILLILIFVGLVAGSYPAFYLTKFKPSLVLKGKVSQGSRNSNFRNSLVVFQFTITVGLIISTLLIYKQMKMVQERNLGFDQENIIVIDNLEALGKNVDAFKQSLLSISAIKHASISCSFPPKVRWGETLFPNGINEETLMFRIIRAESDYLNTLGIKIKDGRYFSPELASDSNAVVINETALKAMGWDSYEGNTLVWGERGNQKEFEVIGVIEDFNFHSLKEDIAPLTIMNKKFPKYLAIRLTEGGLQDKVDQVKKVWDEMSGGEPFVFHFLDQDIDIEYRSEQQLGSIFLIFTALAIFIACLGLFGLAAFMAEQRTKEIGIRKILGASVNHLVALLTKEYMKLVAISIALAAPLALIFASKWLQNFAYKTDIGLTYFVIGGLSAFVITWLTVGYQSFRVALANPAKALRDE